MIDTHFIAFIMIKRFIKHLIYCCSIESDIDNAMQYCNEQYYYHLGKNIKKNK